MSWKLDNISSQEMLVNLCMQLRFMNTLFLETIQILNRKDGSKETQELDLYWKSQRAFNSSSTETYDEFNSEDAFGRVVFNLIKPGEEMVRKSRSVDDRSGKPVETSPSNYSKKGLWSILVFSRVEKWSCGA